jgi:phospholipid transport system substrate-binding protein
MKRLSFFVLGLLFIAQPVFAGPEESAMALVKETTNKIMSTLRAEKKSIDKDPELVTRLVDKIVLLHFDFAKMSEWTLGKYWSKASADQQARFIAEFKMLLIRTYSKALADNSDKEVQFKSATLSKKNNKEATVKTEVPQQAGFPIPIVYRMHMEGDAWKVFDVNIDGISLVRNYRTSFGREVRKSGIEKLIESMKSRNKK